LAHTIITGGSSGIGAALADACAAAGNDVSLIARNEAALGEVQHHLERKYADSGIRIRIAAADVGDAAAIISVIQDCEHELGACDTLITSAGIVAPGRFEEQTTELFDSQIRTNLFGTVNAVRAVYPGMQARKRGRILMIGSGAGLIGIFGYTAYCASKYAVVGFAEALRTEARAHGITVSICFPPDTETPQLAAERALRPPEAQVTIGAGGLWSPEQVARVALAGLDRGRFAIYPTIVLKLLGTFGSVAMPVLRPWFDRKIAASKRGRD
jgi:3-dehydrosphinganine reductase